MREKWELNLTEKLKQCNADADHGRLEHATAILAQKLDVDEELDRIDTHITEVKKVLKREEAVGRRLDFLMQELNREANTLGSKSQDSQTTQWSVDLKVLIEQMREQVQNIEYWSYGAVLPATGMTRAGRHTGLRAGINYENEATVF